ncbi:hypothetical protein [Enterococcus sp. JM9B]|uniref:hypothetical protein n=1 Tax=Enterococcus sp. JM9B TaxID=1857216 RepID=UPI001374B061|nr:hypothetical protein [Enterococcus sp. JM9B]KAF1304847.1 hypothetical protein BAU16_01360 [Enterococcus sp. JM9B]
MSGEVFKYQRNKGYESIPRAFLQDNNLSYEARGLLAELQSYSEEWELYKTELYTRSKKNKRSSIDRIWKELIENRYLIQFRKREGKKWVYQYIFSLEKFSKEDIQEQINFYNSRGFEPYQISNAENQQSKNTDNTNVSSTVENGQSKMDSSKSTRKRFTINKIEEEDNIYNTRVREVLSSTQLFTSSEIGLIVSSLSKMMVDEITIKEQLRSMSEQPQILNPMKYFLNGIQKRLRFETFRQQERLKKTSLPKIQLYDWVAEN